MSGYEYLYYACCYSPINWRKDGIKIRNIEIVFFVYMIMKHIMEIMSENILVFVRSDDVSKI